MATRTNKRTGEVQEMQPDGSWKTIVAPKQGGPALSVLTKAPDPTRPATIRKTTNEAVASDTAPAQAQATLRKTQAEIDNDAAQTRLQRQQFEASLAEKGLMVGPNGQIVARPGGPLKPPAVMDPEKAKTLKALQDQVDRVGELYRSNIKGGLPNFVGGRLPTSANSQFDAAAQGLTNPFLSAFRVQGQGSQSDTELRQFLKANTPSPHDAELEIEEKLGNIQRRIDAETGKADAQASPPAAGDDQVGLAKGKTRSVVDPVLKATGQRLGAMVAQGVPDDKILDFLRRNKVDPANTNIDAVLQDRKSPKFKEWQRQNPGKSYPIGPQFYTKEVPMTAARVMGNMAAQSAPGAFMASAANGVTGGYLDNLTDNPEQARTGMQLLRQEHPLASLAGDVAGYATDEALLGRIPGAQALMASRWGRRGADAIYGAFSGSGENDDNRVGGALGGAALNTAGGMLGRGSQKALGSAVTGVKNANVGYLNNAGVPLTVGQIGNGSGSVIGKAIGGLEDRAAGIPIFDAIINSARRRGEEGFNRAAFREAGGSGITGAPGVEELHQGVNKAYNFLDPVSLPLDAQFAGSQAGVRAALPSLPKYGPEIATGLNAIDSAASGGALNGRDWQQALRTVKSDRASLAGKEFSQGGIDALGDVESNLLGLAARQSPDALQPNLASANALNKQFRTITGALDNGPAQARGELFSPVRLDTASRAAQRKFGGQVSSMEGNRPFYDLTKAGMDVMPNQVPDSGTAGRALMYSTLFGAGVGSGLGYAGQPDTEGAASGAGMGAAAVPFALAALYSKPGQKVLQKMLLGKRPDAMVKVGNYLMRNPKYSGLLTSSAMRDLFLQPELPPQ